MRSLPLKLIDETDVDRSWLSRHLGFITDKHQINVAITRARHGLIIVG